PWDYGNFFAVKDVRAEIDVPSFKVIAAKSWRSRQAHNRLSDVVARIFFDSGPEFFDLVATGLRSHQHSVATALVRGFDDKLRKILQDIFAIRFEVREVGFDVCQDWILIEVVPDHFRHEVIGHLIVCNAGTDRICQADIAAAVSVDETGYTEHGIGSEDMRVEKIVVDSAVNHIDLL